MIYDGPGKVSRPMNGRDYGALWADRFPLAIVLHTTETAGMPGYNGGAYAPHITIDPAKQVVYQHQPLDRRAGSLRGSSQVLRDTGVRAVMNEKAVQVEIIGYSDKATVDKYGGGRRWVGDFTDDDYAFIAAVTHYLKNLFDVGDDLHARPSGRSWSPNISSSHRLGAKEWEQLAGMTAHGGVFGQTHWDTGVLDLHRIWNQPPDEEDDMTPEEREALAELVKLRAQTNPTRSLAGVWDQALADGILTEHSRPGSIVTDERAMAFQERWEKKRMRKLIAAAMAGGAVGGATAAEVIAEIVRRLGN